MKFTPPRCTSWNAEQAAEIIKNHADENGALLPILHALSETFGHVPDEATPLIAKVLNLSRAEVHGVISFYHDFKREPPAKHVLKLCRAEACQARGCDAIAERAEKSLGIAFGETTKDQRVSLEAVYCLGFCASGPSAMLNGHVVARVDEKKLDKLIAETRA